MLISEDHFVEIARNRDFVLLEVLEPSAFAAHGIGQEMHDFAEGYRHGVRRFGRGTVDGFRLGSVVNSQLASGHETCPYVRDFVLNGTRNRIHRLRDLEHGYDYRAAINAHLL